RSDVGGYDRGDTDHEHTHTHDRLGRALRFYEALGHGIRRLRDRYHGAEELGVLGRRDAGLRVGPLAELLTRAHADVLTGHGATRHDLQCRERTGERPPREPPS